jgi:ssDNA-binding Zn-finger/Zn-ribbon topoisomerase 1
MPSTEGDVSLSDDVFADRCPLPCPDCGAPMRLKTGKFGPFYGCTAYEVSGCKGVAKVDRFGGLAGIPVPKPTRDLRRAIWQRLQELQENGESIPKWLEKVRLGELMHEECLAILGRLRTEMPTVWDVLDGPGLV